MTRAHWIAAALLAVACGSSTPPQPSGSGSGGEASSCPATAAAPAMLPGIETKHRQVGYWTERVERPDEVLLTAAQIADHDAALAARDAERPEEDPLAPYDLSRPEDPARLARELDARLAFLAEEVSAGRYVDGAGQPVEGAAFTRHEPTVEPEVRVALAEIPIRCGPRREGLYKAPDVDQAFDRNACSTLRPQEPVRILATWPGGMKLVRTRYALGFMAGDAPLSPALAEPDAAAFASHAVHRLSAPAQLAGVDLPAHTRLARRGDEVLVAGPDGVEAVAPPPGAVAAPRALTRRALFEEAFRYLDSPYGWGGQGGGRDCSRFLLDVFAAFGLGLPRHSAQQALAGSFQLDVTAATSERERLGILDAAARQGVVLLHFPGHIMLYLGRADDGRPMAIHAFAEYLERCGEGETRRTVDRVHVSDLSLGAGTSRRSFLERITHVTVFGPSPGAELAGAAVRRPAAPMEEAKAPCEGDATIVTTPRRPHPGAPLRVIATSRRDLGSVAIALFDPDGERHTPPLRRLGGPPYGYWTEIEAPAVGKWTVQIGDGARVEGCERVTVHERGDYRQAAGGSVWRPQRAWDAASEDLFAAFVEQLFAYPLDDRTWPSLQALLTDREHNLLHDHLGQKEEAALALRPDCADLPYFLRAYFAWKMRLPFTYRHCNRGFSGKAPYCDRDLKSHLEPIEDASSATRAFFEFARRNIADGVHSGSGRTAPGDEHSDYYPLPITREAIRPGTMFADPYGHLFVIAAWVPQGIGSHGILVGADAQPDGTIGRRRFWPGSFLFTPDTDEAGAGFKAFRPVRYRGGSMRAVKNADIGAIEGYPPHSLEQYAGTAREFYDRVEALINPRPLDPKATLDVLIDALHEQVKRRVVSVQNAEDFKASRKGAIEMPTGHAIFETSGPWEDFSTPSRDMRLLIAIDTVVGFVEGVKRSPGRFGIGAGEIEAVAAELAQHLEAELSRRDFAYRRSDGSTQALTVADVVARAGDFELAYNPNDCVEIRWAAPKESDERATCGHEAPAHQRERMESYRSWFATRRRPAR